MLGIVTSRSNRWNHLHQRGTLDAWHQATRARRPRAFGLFLVCSERELWPRPTDVIDLAKLEVLVSAATPWEISTKHRLGKLPGAAGIVADLNAAIDDQSFTASPIRIRHGQDGGALPGPHRDPFDRMRIAQAMVENLVLVSNEQGFGAYGVGRLW
jgi:PIN domain nuclease of toxin-antitoxin system